MIELKVKKCTICKEEKPINKFNKNKRKKDGLNTLCKDCSRKRSRKYYKENKEYHKKQVTKRKKSEILKARKFIFEYLKYNSCIDCGEKDPVCLEFDHITDKKMCISRMAGAGYSVKTIKIEISKCVIRCANCHRKKTAKELGWYKYL
jgi:hypothetical protein